MPEESKDYLNVKCGKCGYVPYTMCDCEQTVAPVPKLTDLICFGDKTPPDCLMVHINKLELDECKQCTWGKMCAHDPPDSLVLEDPAT